MTLKSILRKLFESEFKELHAQISSKNDTILSLQTEKESAMKCVSSLQENVTCLNDKVTNLNEHVKNLNNQVADLENQKKDLESSFKAEREQLFMQIRSEAEQKDKNLQTVLDERENHANEISRLTNEHNTELNIVRSDLARAEGQVDAMNQNVNSLLSEKRSIEEQIASLNESLQHQASELANSVSKIEELNANINSLENDKQLLQEQLTQARQSNVSEDVVAALRSDNSAKSETITSLESEIQKLNENIADLTNEKEELKLDIEQQRAECNNLKDTLTDYAQRIESVNEMVRQLDEARRKISELERQISTLPTPEELVKKDALIAKLQKELESLKNKSGEQPVEVAEPSAPEPVEPPKTGSIGVKPPQKPVIPSSTVRAPRYKRIKSPYKYIQKAPSKDVVTKDFPKIENDNVYGSSTRIIDEVFNCRTNSIVRADSILMNWTAERISRLSLDLVEAHRKDEPYLVCPCCRQMLKLASRKVGFGSTRRDVQYFTHAVRNLPCELKRDYSPSIPVSVEGDDLPLENGYAKDLRTLISDSLNTELSRNKGFSDVEMLNYISSEELPIMKRRLADVVASYNSRRIVFELVTPNTNISKVHDRDLFYLINHIQVFWIFGLDAIDDYSKLRTSLAKDVLFTNKRNVFVFDIEAQEASKQRGELILKCNWLDENQDWYYNHSKNGRNGILLSLDQIKFDDDSCRPFYYDADEPYFLAHPTAERPAKLSREELIKDIKNAWQYEQDKKTAVADMIKIGSGVEAFCQDGKWGFKYGETIFIEPKFTEEPEIIGYFAKVKSGDKYGVVNRFGEYSLQPEYDEIRLLQNGQILYCDRKEWRLFGVIDKLCDYAATDEVVINTISQQAGIYQLIIHKFLYANQPSEEFYFVGNEIFKKNVSSGKWSLWLSCGIKSSDVTWDSMEFTSEEQIKVSLNGRTLLLTLDGAIIEEQKYKETITLSNGNVLVETFEGIWGITNASDVYLIEPMYSSIELISDEYLKVCKNGSWGICSINGEIIIEPQFRSIIDFDGNSFTVTKTDLNKSWLFVTGKVNLKGEPIIELSGHFENGTDLSISFERYGVHKDGKELIPNSYLELSYWGQDKYIAKKDDKYGLISIDNKILLPFEYQSIKPLSDNRSIVKKGLSTYKIDANLSVVDDETINLEDGFKKVKMAGKWGIVNPQGDVIVDYKYDEITTFRGRLIGIINGKLVKLSAYYPHRLQMYGVNDSGVANKDIVKVSSLKFQLIPKRSDAKSGTSVKVALVNLTSMMKYPIVQIFNDATKGKKAKHIDKPDDYTVGETYLASVSSFILGKYNKASKGKIRGVDVKIGDNSISHVYKSAFTKANISLDSIHVGDKLELIKHGYDDELDRTIWEVKVVSE